jgi:uncharacterized protein YutE (UPF0331/DUF86 family)
VSSPAQAWLPETEQQFLEGLRARYEDQGFDFTVAPDSRELPDFLGPYRPNALARKPGLNVAIEVKRQQTLSGQRSLQQIRQLLEGHPDWQLKVVYMGADPSQSVNISPAPLAALRARMEEIRALNADGHRRAAFVMAWSVLEAALNSVRADARSKPRAPGTVLESLAMDGYIEPDMERRMRSLIEPRNRIVHGDLDVEPTSADVELVLSAVSETLAAKAA